MSLSHLIPFLATLPQRLTSKHPFQSITTSKIDSLQVSTLQSTECQIPPFTFTMYQTSQSSKTTYIRTFTSISHMLRTDLIQRQLNKGQASQTLNFPFKHRFLCTISSLDWNQRLGYIWKQLRDSCSLAASHDYCFQTLTTKIIYYKKLPLWGNNAIRSVHPVTAFYIYCPLFRS